MVKAGPGDKTKKKKAPRRSVKRASLLDTPAVADKVAKAGAPPPASGKGSKKSGDYEMKALSKKAAEKLLASLGTSLPPPVEGAADAKAVTAQRKRRQRKANEQNKGSAFVPRAVMPETMLADAETSGWRVFPIHEQLQAGLTAMGLTTPTYIQSQVLPRALQGRCDILGAAPTGSGKTLAYGIPLVQRVLEQRTAAGGEPRLRGLIVAPTRELAMQVTAHLRGLVQCCEPMVRIATVVGGMAVQKQTDRLLRRPDILIATPGRLAEYLEDRRATGPHGEAARYVADMAGLAAIALDEADRMVEDGH
jgi:ATP-dependent RNA helicase DDX24/MAK5